VKSGGTQASFGLDDETLEEATRIDRAPLCTIASARAGATSASTVSPAATRTTRQSE
jgi:hypothetical protein